MRVRGDHIVWTVAVVVLAVRCACSFAGSPTAEVVLHNAAGTEIGFLVKPLYEDVKWERHEVAVGDTWRRATDARLEIRVLPRELNVVYRLEPGRSYVFRLLEPGIVRLFPRSQNHDSALELAPFVATPMSVVHASLELLDIGGEDVVFDLGCGDGRVVVAAVRDHGARGVGVDIDPMWITEARNRAAEAGVEDRVRFLEQDIFETDVSEATVVFVYLYTDSNRLLRPYLEEHLRAGTVVACHGFPIPGWHDILTASHEIQDDHGLPRTVYLYRWREESAE